MASFAVRPVAGGIRHHISPRPNSLRFVGRFIKAWISPHSAATGLFSSSVFTSSTPIFVAATTSLSSGRARKLLQVTHGGTYCFDKDYLFLSTYSPFYQIHYLCDCVDILAHRGLFSLSSFSWIGQLSSVWYNHFCFSTRLSEHNPNPNSLPDDVRQINASPDGWRKGRGGLPR